VVPVVPAVPPVVPVWPAAPVEADPAPEPAACGIMFAARSPPVAKGLCSDEVGVVPCLQWSATWVTLVTWYTCPAPALVLVPVPAPALPEPDTPAWPTLPVPAPVEALAFAAD
jgi:hypothetical protein